MATETQTEALHDLESLMESAAARRPVDPAVVARVQHKADEIRKRLPETNVAVDLIRDARNP